MGTKPRNSLGPTDDECMSQAGCRRGTRTHRRKKGAGSKEREGTVQSIERSLARDGTAGRRKKKEKRKKERRRDTLTARPGIPLLYA